MVLLRTAVNGEGNAYKAIVHSDQNLNPQKKDYGLTGLGFFQRFQKNKSIPVAGRQ